AYTIRALRAILTLFDRTKTTRSTEKSAILGLTLFFTSDSFRVRYARRCRKQHPEKAPTYRRITIYDARRVGLHSKTNTSHHVPQKV
ncbi:MAG: hypothetical protein ACI8ZW_001248, partial [Yoonia sp.]